ncbi:hypothetical protein LCGC14_1265360 [marine sediment metagenome]|uniref:Uncharacterized protein n=1 Tax=marine sediment metagenome TaxID=412755 RepID=A0A0F9P2Y7_9ZZZZ
MKLGDIESVELTKLPISISEILDEYVLVKHGLEIESFIEPMFRGMVYRIKTFVLAEEIDCRSKVVSIDTVHPVFKSLWQHFKSKVFPTWLLKHFPPQYNWVTVTGKKKVTFRKYATYPKANILFPDKVGNLIRYKSFLEESDI